MATIDMRRNHSLTVGDAKLKAEEFAKSMETKLGLRWKWEGDVIRFDAPGGAAKGVSGEVGVNSREVRVQIDLPFLLRALKGTIEGKVKTKLDTLIGPA
jgi:putative polyhydroxyalkanoate system protein